MSRFNLILSLIAFACSAFGQVLPEASATPPPLTEIQRKLVREASMLQAAGKFDEAIKKLTEAEKEAAGNEVIPFELAKSHLGKKNYAKCIEKGKEAAKYVSGRLPRIYTVIGNCHDAMEDSVKALEIYDFALQKFPNDGTLHLHRATTLSNMQKFDDARKAAKRSARLDPNNANTHFLLAAIFLEQEYRVPAILASARFITLEPGSVRTPMVLGMLKKAFETKPKSTNKTSSVSLDSAAKTDEGDFSSLEMVLAGNWVQDPANTNKKTDVERSIEQFELILNLLPVDKEPRGEPSFTDSYYVPYFKQMQERKLVETLWQMIYAAGKRSESEKWLSENQAKVNDFMNWSSGYQWPKAN